MSDQRTNVPEIRGQVDVSTIDAMLEAAIAEGGLPTEDVLAAIVSLMQQCISTHEAGHVAPLEGLAMLRVDAGHIFFSAADQQPLRRNVSQIHQIEAADTATLEIVDDIAQVTGKQGQQQYRDQRVADASVPLKRPVYVNGFVTWEHLVQHHDPLTDVLSLGQILACLACGIDFRDLDQVQHFAANRNNLFALKESLHPVLAQAIYRMTELHRARRVQDLPSMVATLQNYRDASTNFDFDLSLDVEPTAEETRSAAILGRLRRRLFEITRRNRLLNFSATMATINLTQASVPLSLDPSKIDLKKLLIADDSMLRRLGAGNSVSLSSFINFQEVLYATSVLDRIITDDRRERAEYGFGGLRLAMAFLNWADVKSKPPQKYNSPLVLVSVTLKKKKGVRDTYYLEASDSDAEVNPVLRHLMNQLYGIELPETIPLQAGAIAELAERLRIAIAASDTSVELSIVERPQIELIRAKAQKRLQQYQRRARVSGRGVRNYGDLQYSYDPANYHPLGLRLFESKVRQPTTNLEAITRKEIPARTHQMAQAADDDELYSTPEPSSTPGPNPKPGPNPTHGSGPTHDPDPAQEKATSPPNETETPAENETQKTFYRWKEGGSDNPYHWQVDLCNITLASFRYRRMSLVRDYDSMLRDGTDNASFEALFSSVPREATRALPQELPVDQRFDVVPCDPTQAQAISEARAGHNYIVQGPPGTGKSQTITNLIADYVARGQRVLFVCEKRAAIDVVFARLKAIGLGPVCCLIHDAQADKKDFVHDLRSTYETFLTTKAPTRKSKASRDKLAADMGGELAHLMQVDEVMNTPLDDAGLSLMELLDRCLELESSNDLQAPPTITALERERLPPYVDWRNNELAIASVAARLQPLQPDGILARHPLSILRCDLVSDSEPLARVTGELATARRSLGQLEEKFESLGLAPSVWQSFECAQSAIAYAEAAAPLARANLLAAVEKNSKASRSLNQKLRYLKRLHDTADESSTANQNWRQKLSAEDTDIAMSIAEQCEGRLTSLLSPRWWRLRGLLNRSYDFTAHAIRPSWVSVLLQLQTEHDHARAVDVRTRKLQDEYGLEDDPLQWNDRITDLRKMLSEQPDLQAQLHAPMLQSRDAGDTLQQIADAREQLTSVQKSLDSICDAWSDLLLPELRQRLATMENSLDQVPRFLTVLESLQPMPERLAWALRRLPVSHRELERTLADETYQRQLRRNPSAESFSGGTRNSHAQQLRSLYGKWLRSNSDEVLHQVVERFAAHVQQADDTSSASRDEKQWRKSYQKGRRELEHEFGKQMRYKPIRKLLSGETRQVIVDLKPVWLMSPLSVSETLPLDDDVDVVIFDEASQVTLEEAVPSLCRGRQSIVVGDQMQLPPSNFFSSKSSADEEDDEFAVRDEEGDDVHYDLSSASFLDFADRNLPSTMLGWHYRSRSESLISFSNWRFYNGRLLTVPEERLRGKPISFHFMENGCYENRKNRCEAEHIAGLVRELLCGAMPVSDPDNPTNGLPESLPKNPTIGVIAFSEAQQSEIESALSRLAEQDRDFAEKLDAELVREDDGQFVGLLVKNLENIQGDERDIVLMSICYGPDPQGKIRMNFGPINRSGGEKRLNVAFSRAKHHMAIVTSIRYGAITNDYNNGAATLQDYLQYAEAISDRRSEQAAGLLARIGRQRVGSTFDSEVSDSVLKEQVSAALRAAGWQVDLNVGQSHFRIDIAVRSSEDETYRLGILLDDASYRESDPFERDVQRPQLLEDFGWQITHVLAKDWYLDAQSETQRLLKRLGASVY
ncbi:AAA domain-containing protein [Neorhodopirellula lusitana]|uniref:AAA domain-containing protein n=1 Tax=Neorhodopirellula lusitana TaxID=445327 RepID=UPI00384B28BA